MEELQEEDAVKEQPDRAEVDRAQVMFTLNSRDLRMWFSMISSRMISFPLGDWKCDAGMSVENVPAVVNIQTLKG